MTQQEPTRTAPSEPEGNAAMDEVARLMAKIAHDINNPLAAIIGFADLLQVERSPDKLSRYARIISSQAERARKLVENLVMHTRQRPPQLRPMDVNAIVRAVVASREVQLDVEGIRLVQGLATTLPQIQGDPQQLSQVVYNVLLNAEQAVSTTRGQRQIAVETGIEPGAVVVRVTDSGSGLTDEALTRAFEAFFTTRSKGGGSGLGLTVSRGIAERHGGTLDLARGGSGAVCELRIPAETPDEPALGSGDQVGPLAGRRILIVEDQSFLLDLYVELVEALGGIVTRATSAAEALARVRAETPSLVIASNRLPGDGAKGLHASLAAEAPDLARRFIAIVVEPVDAPTRRWLSDTGVPSLAKPFTLDEVQTAARKLLAG